MLGRRSANILKDNKGDGCGCSGGSEDGDDKCFATTGSPVLARPPAPRLFSGDRFTVPFFAISVCTAGEKKKNPVVLFTLCLQRGVCRVISHTGISSPDEVSYGHDQFTEPSNCRPHVPIVLPGTWLSRVSGDDRYSPTTPLWS